MKRLINLSGIFLLFLTLIVPCVLSESTHTLSPGMHLVTIPSITEVKRPVIIFEKPEITLQMASVPIDQVTDQDLLEWKRLGEMELLSQLVQAEAGNQDLTGMRYVADVVLNRVDDPRFPNTIEEVIFQRNPTQFAVTIDGAFEKAAWNMSENAYLAVQLEWEQRLDSGILYFNSGTDPMNGRSTFKYGDHWFGY